MIEVFHERLKELRQGKNMTQQELADVLSTKIDGVKLKKQTISSYENNTEPNIAMLKNIAEVFNVTVDYLTGNSDYKNEIMKTLPDAIDIPKELEDVFMRITDKFFNTITLSVHPFIPNSLLPSDRKVTYSDSLKLLEQYENSITWLNDYIMQSLVDIENNYEFSKALSSGNPERARHIEKDTKRRNKDFCYMRFNHSITTFINLIQGQFKDLYTELSEEQYNSRTE